jgi:uncharacterized protein YxjI
MLATFMNHSTNQEVTIELRGDMWGGSADLSLEGRPVAQISRQLFNMREAFLDQQTVSDRMPSTYRWHHAGLH